MCKKGEKWRSWFYHFANCSQFSYSQFSYSLVNVISHLLLLNDVKDSFNSIQFMKFRKTIIHRT